MTRNIDHRRLSRLREDQGDVALATTQATQPAAVDMSGIH